MVEQQDNVDNESGLLSSEELEKHQEQIQRLQGELQRQLDERKEERLIWILVVTVLLDVYFFTSMDNIAGPIVILVFQVLVVVMVATKMGMEQVVQLIDRMIAMLARNITGD